MLDFGFKPSVGQVVTVFDYGTHSGTFSSIVGVGDAAGFTFTPVYNATNFQVEVAAAVPEPNSLWLYGFGLIGVIVCARRKSSRAGAHSIQMSRTNRGDLQPA